MLEADSIGQRIFKNMVKIGLIDEDGNRRFDGDFLNTWTNNIVMQGFRYE